jgi:hypothetical protein
MFITECKTLNFERENRTRLRWEASARQARFDTFGHVRTRIDTSNCFDGTETLSLELTKSAQVVDFPPLKACFKIHSTSQAADLSRVGDLTPSVFRFWTAFPSRKQMIFRSLRKNRGDFLHFQKLMNNHETKERSLLPAAFAQTLRLAKRMNTDKHRYRNAEFGTRSTE